MAWVHFSTSFLALLLLAGPSLSAVCPDSCVCVTRDGLHRATCSSLPELYKFTLRQKHHNINILDLSHNNITKLTHELDRLTEVVTLDLSTNGITDIKKFLNNAKKLVHLNLANNRIRTLSAAYVPSSVSSLDLTNNLLKDVPSDLEHLRSLEHLQLEGNPLDCSCKNIQARDSLLAASVFIDKVKCETPDKVKGRSWLELKTRDICKIPKVEANSLDMMMGDQPIDAVQVGEESTALKSMSNVSDSVLEEGHVIKGESLVEDDDSLQFMRVSRSSTTSPLAEIEGSGDMDSTTIIADIIEPIQERKLSTNLMDVDEILPANNIHTTEDNYEGSAEGSGFGAILYNEPVIEATTPMLEELNPGPVTRLFEDDTLNGSTEFPMPSPPTLYQGDLNWHSQTVAPVIEKAATPLPDTTMSQKVTSELAHESSKGVKPTTHKTGTYICIAIIVILLVGLIGFAIIKGQMRKKRDRRLLRQQKRDVERASKEMVDMNQSLLGKPAIIDPAIEKKVNGKYELVPTHESHQKKSENGEVANGINCNSANSAVRHDSPRDSNQNKNSSKDQNWTEDKTTPIQETSFESPEAPDSRKDRHSLSSDDIFVPINDDDTRKINGNADFDITHPLLNGNQLTDSDFLSPSREYVPVYSPDMGRVRIKMAETPKPKTPVLVTRSRSNAGDIVITPSLDGNLRKSTT